MRLTAGLDSGPVCLAASEPIRADESYGSLAPRLAQIGGELLMRALEEAPPFVEQADEGASYAEKIGSEDRLLDPSRPAAELERHVRALHPHIGARARLDDGTMLAVRRAALVDEGPDGEDQARGEAGSDAPALGVRARDERLLMACVTGTLELLVVQPPGGLPMDAASYLRGHGLPGRR
jgi:methionyl-tRNA formyltransferase